jgi:hypothetical protein
MGISALESRGFRLTKSQVWSNDHPGVKEIRLQNCFAISFKERRRRNGNANQRRKRDYRQKRKKRNAKRVEEVFKFFSIWGMVASRYFYSCNCYPYFRFDQVIIKVAKGKWGICEF